MNKTVFAVYLVFVGATLNLGSPAQAPAPEPAISLPPLITLAHFQAMEEQQGSPCDADSALWAADGAWSASGSKDYLATAAIWVPTAADGLTASKDSPLPSRQPINTSLN